jgi:PEP-CTERM motif
MSLSTARWTAVLGSAVVLLFSSAMPASAVIIGTLETGSGGTITYTATSITINTDPSSNPAGPPWNGEVANGTSLMFAGCPSGVLGTAGCLDASPNSPNEAIEFAKNTPITGVLAANNPFVQFAGNGTSHANLLFTVTAIGPGSANTNCGGAVNVGDSCSPFPGSPLVLTKTAVGTNVSFGMFGTATDGVGSSTWSGQLESPFTGETPAQIQGLLATGSVTSSQSGEFVAASTTVPEPATISLLGIGLLGLGRGLRKRSTR